MCRINVYIIAQNGREISENSGSCTVLHNLHTTIDLITTMRLSEKVFSQVNQHMMSSEQVWRNL
jgi:hypothetical protein